MKLILLIGLITISSFGFSQSVEGIWQTFNDETNKVESDVKVYIKNGKLYGKIVKMYDATEAELNAKCTNCTGAKKNQPIMGMVFINGLHENDGKWEKDGGLLHPETGKVYDAAIWLENDNKLAVRGYLGWLYETKYWKRK
ncbi:DUF2147 domain-containing protein [Brumimicrobium mesophilum]|uniref:DUF2147 domain-containing protein n=1 Tax=Brumimicrobium mesophilum TaxID=392717 RepID=UPI000D144CCE|nr:DUF2147 domain-containing protein [Brumimicrobium mesophilum]